MRVRVSRTNGDDADRSRRAYRSAARESQARTTRSRIRHEAGRLFLERGYASTTIADVAQAAEVTAQTVYNVFGTKAALLKSVYDVTLVGDDEPVPLAQRPEMAAVLAATDGRTLLAAYSRISMVLMQRLAGVITMVEEGAASGDPDLLALVATTATERRAGSARAVDRAVALSGLREGVSLQEAKDLLWMLSGVHVWRHLVEQSGWTPEAYAAYLGRAAADAILPPCQDAAASPPADPADQGREAAIER